MVLISSIFDCLNDIRNLRQPSKPIKKRTCTDRLCYTLGDAYTLTLKIHANRIEDMGLTPVCIKDMAGL